MLIILQANSSNPANPLSWDVYRIHRKRVKNDDTFCTWQVGWEKTKHTILEAMAGVKHGSFTQPYGLNDE